MLHVEAATTLTKASGEDWVFDLDDTGNGVPLAYAGGSVEIMRVRKGVLRGEATATSANYMPYSAKTFMASIHGLAVDYLDPSDYAVVGAGSMTDPTGEVYYTYNPTNGQLFFSLLLILFKADL